MPRCILYAEGESNFAGFDLGCFRRFRFNRGDEMKKQKWLTGRRTDARGALSRDSDVSGDSLVQAESIITDVAVQVGALINGVCCHSKGSSTKLGRDRVGVTIRFSWAEFPETSNRGGLMRIVLLDDGLVRVSASTKGAPGGQRNESESIIALRELSREKLGQILMDNHARVTRSLIPGVCQTVAVNPQPESEESVWARMKSLALVDSGQQLAVQGL